MEYLAAEKPHPVTWEDFLVVENDSDMVISIGVQTSALVQQAVAWANGGLEFFKERMIW